MVYFNFFLHFLIADRGRFDFAGGQKEASICVYVFVYMIVSLYACVLTWAYTSKGACVSGRIYIFRPWRLRPNGNSGVSCGGVCGNGGSGKGGGGGEDGGGVGVCSGGGDGGSGGGGNDGDGGDGGGDGGDSGGGDDGGGSSGGDGGVCPDDI